MIALPDEFLNHVRAHNHEVGHELDHAVPGASLDERDISTDRWETWARTRNALVDNSR